MQCASLSKMLNNFFKPYVPPKNYYNLNFKKYLIIWLYLTYTYVVNGINKWIVTAVAHGEPVETEPYDVNVRVPKKNKKKWT